MRNISPVARGTLALALAVAALATTPVEPGIPPTNAIAVVTSSALSDDERRIARVRERWLAAVNAGDLRGILAAYAPGAVLLPEALPPFLGAASIGRWHQRWLPLADVHYALEATLLDVDGAWALARVDHRPRLVGVVFEEYRSRQLAVHLVE